MNQSPDFHSQILNTSQSDNTPLDNLLQKKNKQNGQERLSNQLKIVKFKQRAFAGIQQINF